MWALSLSNEALLNANLKPLADNWRILALVEAECGLNAGIRVRSRAVQTGPGLASIESMIGFARYGHALKQDSLDETLASGIRAVSGMRIAAAAVAGTRVDIDAVAATPLAEMLADPQWRDAVIRLSVDVLVARRLQGQWAPDLLEKVRGGWSRIVGDGSLVDAVIKAATGRYAVGASASFNLVVTCAAAREDDQLAADPALRFRRDMMLVGHVSQSLRRRVLEPLLVPVLQRDWTNVLAGQRFRLRTPTQTCPAIEQAVAELPVDGLRAAARLIIAAAPSVGETMTGSWKTVLGSLANMRAK